MIIIRSNKIFIEDCKISAFLFKYITFFDGLNNFLQIKTPY